MSSSTQADKEEVKGTRLWILYLALFAVFVTWATSGYILYPLESTIRGTFGDMFGAVNSLFSGLAFAALIFTVFMQREELSLQRKELEYTRQELRRSAAAQEASEAALRAQAEATAQAATLNATHTLITYYREAIAELMQRSIQLEPNTQSKIDFLQAKMEPLFTILEGTYQRITQKHTENRQNNSGTPTHHPTPEN